MITGWRQINHNFFINLDKVTGVQRASDSGNLELILDDDVSIFAQGEWADALWAELITITYEDVQPWRDEMRTLTEFRLEVKRNAK